MDHFTPLQRARMQSQFSAFRWPTAPQSAPALPPTPSPPAVCFSSVSSVTVRNKGVSEMIHLQVGDQVQTNNGFAPIYGFAHSDTTSETVFLQIYTEENGKWPLEISGDHLVFLANDNIPVRADSIRVGHMLANEAAGTLVTSIGVVTRSGLYAPLTSTGTINVDGIVSSCYVSLQQGASKYVELQGGIRTFLSHHRMVHMWLAPIRMVCMGISSSLCKSFDEETGLAHFVQLGFAVSQFIDRQNLIVQILFLILYLLILAPFAVLEWIAGPQISIYVLAACIILAEVHRRGSIRHYLLLKKKKAH
jgi:Hint module